jgi:type I protein arginine methyltransferase
VTVSCLVLIYGIAAVSSSRVFTAKAHDVRQPELLGLDHPHHWRFAAAGGGRVLTGNQLARWFAWQCSGLTPSTVTSSLLPILVPAAVATAVFWTAPGLELHLALQASIGAGENTSPQRSYDADVRTPIRNPPDPMYAEFEVHRTMICDRVRTEAFRRAIDSVVRPGDIVLDVGAGSGILSVFAARAGAARVYAVERTSAAVLAQELAAANGVAEIVRVIHGDVMDVELPERVDVIVSEWLGGFGIDEGMLVPVIVARDRWLKAGGVMIPRLVMAWAALVHDRYLGEMVEFLRDNPYGLRFDDLVEKTVNEIFYSGTFRHLAGRDKRSEASRLWTTDTGLIPVQQAQAPHEAETVLPVRDYGTANALALWFSAQLAPGISLSVGPGDPPTHWGMTTAPLRSPVELTPGMVVRTRVRTVPARPAGTWTSWAVALPGADWEEHDEQAIWQEIED